MTVRHQLHAPPPGRPRDCARCGATGHASDAAYCRVCGAALPQELNPNPNPVQRDPAPGP
jgi:hypothetical protein